MSEQPRTPRPDVVDEIEVVEVRRSPRYGVFLGLGVALGVLVAAILTFTVSGNDQSATGIVYSDAQVFGFLALICGAIGLGLGGALAIVLDRTVGRRRRRFSADHARVTPGS
ncbi:potassium transporter Trk [Microbacterium sp. X-17]|uniref:potassium transporter Trk n=1 Tax=Microbacterium sp. X-17 TaxID=3144404 RepID=UPI0031F58D28